jgi:aspartate/methionine/tyrosine aminotransferase
VRDLAPSRSRGAGRVAHFTESVIREMTRLADDHGAINLAQGFPDFDTPDEIKEAARHAIAAGINQYPVTWGSPRFRSAIAAKYRAFGWPEVEPETEIVVTCGSTEAMAATYLALLDPGDEVIVFEPYYENYGPDAYMAGARPVVVPLDPPDWRVDLERVAAAVTDRTRAMVITTPHNPTGKVFAREELAALADLAIERDLLVFTDEIYEHILYDGREHLSMALVPGMAERTVTISALSKTYSVTGWRVGWAIASAPIMASIRKVHDFLTVAAPAPLQEAGVTAMEMPPAFYGRLALEYDERRSTFLSMVGEAYDLIVPEGAYYAMARIGALRERTGAVDDTAFCHDLVLRAGVAAVPGSSFFADGRLGHDLIRFAFPKRLETLRRAGERLAEFADGS